jgi:hypothetical protein
MNSISLNELQSMQQTQLSDEECIQALESFLSQDEVKTVTPPRKRKPDRPSKMDAKTQLHKRDLKKSKLWSANFLKTIRERLDGITMGGNIEKEAWEKITTLNWIDHLIRMDQSNLLETPLSELIEANIQELEEHLKIIKDYVTNIEYMIKK